MAGAGDGRREPVKGVGGLGELTVELCRPVGYLRDLLAGQVAVAPLGLVHLAARGRARPHPLVDQGDQELEHLRPGADRRPHLGSCGIVAS